MHKILIIDDEIDIREILSEIFSEEGYVVFNAHNAASALKAFADNKPGLAILDIWLEGSKTDGIGVLKSFKKMSPDVPIIMISGHGSIETAVQTIKLGAYDFIEKPFKAEKILLLVKRALELTSLKEEIKDLKGSSQLETQLSGTSRAISAVSEAAKLAAQSSGRIFITGEAGVGKEVLAHMIHLLSPRRDMPFIRFHAQSMVEKEMEAELFGIEDGIDSRVGKLELANGGTLLIDEIGSLTSASQIKLLKYLQENCFTRAGSSKDIKANVRVICSSTYDLTQEALTGKFNQSLFYRLNVVPIHIPPLRDRKEDLPALADDLSQKLSANLGMPKPEFSQDALIHMQLYSWPGNIRELKNVLEWLMILKGKSNSEIQVSDLPQAITSKTNDLLPTLNEELMLKPLKSARDLFEKEYLKAQLNRFDGNISKTADFVGMDRTALHRKLKSLQISGE